MTIEINRRKSPTVYRINPYNGREIDSRPNRHGARWQHYCSCASEDEARSVLLRLEKDTSQEVTP